MAAVDTKHPDYVDHAPEWKMVRDAERGPSAVYRAGVQYLPMPSGFTAQSDDGAAMYDAYARRARFPDIVAPAIRGMTGLVHRKESIVELPAQMEPLREKCTREGLTLDAFHMQVTQELLRVGRFGILSDATEEGSDVPFLAGYATESIINWDNVGEFFVLDESGPERQGFEWKNKKQFRVLELVNGDYVVKLYDDTTDSAVARTVHPQKRGNGALEAIPFVIVSPTEISTRVGQIPLVGVTRASVAIYQLDADYRLQLFMSGQETFVVTGADKPPDIVGASVRLAFENTDAKAFYVGPTGIGITMHRQAIEDAKADAVSLGAQLFDSKKAGYESGEALRLRYGAQSATLTTIAVNSARALEKALRNIALFMNLDPKKVVVKPNLRFADTVLTAQDAESFMRLWMGAAISKETMFENFKRGELVPEDRTFEVEEEKIANDAIDRPVPGGGEVDDTPDEEDDAPEDDTGEGA